MGRIVKQEKQDMKLLVVAIGLFGLTFADTVPNAPNCVHDLGLSVSAMGVGGSPPPLRNVMNCFRQWKDAGAPQIHEDLGTCASGLTMESSDVEVYHCWLMAMMNCYGDSASLVQAGFGFAGY